MHITIHTYRHHPIDQTRVTKLIEKSIPHKIAQSLKSAGEFETLLDYNESVIFGALRHQNFDPKILQASAKLILEVVKANFDMALSSSPEVQIELANHSSLIKKVGHNKWLFFGGYYHAFTFRAAKFREYLDTIKYEEFLVTDTEYDLFNVCHYDVLKGLGKLKKADLIRRFNSGYKHLFGLNRSHTEEFRIFYPLWEYIINENPGLFNEKLEQAIHEHKKLWSKGEKEDIENDPKGHRNIFLTGIMSYAKEINFPVNHSSDYTPQYLVEGNCTTDINSTIEFKYTPNEISKQELLDNLKRINDSEGKI